MEGGSKAVVPYQTGWFNTVLAAVLPYIIWVPYQVYLSLYDGSWRDFVKQMTFGSAAQGSSLRSGSPVIGKRQLQQKAKPMKPEIKTEKGVTWEKLSCYMELYSVQETDSPSCRRLVLMYAWLTSKRHHVQKYASLFTDQGMDVVTVKITGMDLMQPTSGAQVVAQQVVDFLATNTQYTKVLVFGFSVGAYVCSETVKMIHDVPEYSGIKHRIVGHAWDSPVDLPNMPIGVATTVTTNEKIRGYVSSCVDWFLRARHDVATRHYLAAADFFYMCPVAGPGLFMCSTCDPLSPVTVNEQITRRWKDLGYDITTKVFDGTPHCANYSKYPLEYRRLILQFLERVDLLK